MLYIYHPFPTAQHKELQNEVKVYNELNIAHGSSIQEIPAKSVVIPRFRMLPFAKELEHEVSLQDSRLINSYNEHRNIANLYTWVNLLEGLTPPAFPLEAIPSLPEGEYFVKGETNSKKSDWFNSAYAPNKKALVTVVGNLLNDAYVGDQQIAIRPFQAYRKIAESVTGQPIFNERRAFYLDGVLLSDAPYWSIDSFGEHEPLISENLARVQQEAIEKVKSLARFIVIDYAEYEDGSWGVVELNDGAMSGLSANDPYALWAAVKKHLS